MCCISGFWEIELLIFLLLFKVRVLRKAEIEQCSSSGDPHYYVLHPQGHGRLVFIVCQGILIKDYQCHIHVFCHLPRLYSTF